MNKTLVTGGQGLVRSSITTDYKISREFDLTNFNETQKKK
jgi:hypothetical protein